MTPAAFARLTCALCFALAFQGCIFAKESRYPVNSHDSTPVSQREDGNEYARIKDRTAIVAFEYGRCETNADCAPRGCDHAVCAPAGLEATCISDEVSLCLGDLPTSLCGCTDEGVCRWTRNNLVMECANLQVEKTQTRPYDGAPEQVTYPWRPYD